MGREFPETVRRGATMAEEPTHVPGQSRAEDHDSGEETHPEGPVGRPAGQVEGDLMDPDKS